MEIVWTTSNFPNISLEEEIEIAINYTKFMILDYRKILWFLKNNNLESLINFFKSKEITPLMISHEYKLGLTNFQTKENITEIYKLTKDLGIPFLLVNPDIKPENLSFNVALEAFIKFLNEILAELKIPLIVRINANSIVNTLGKAYKLVKSNDQIYLGFDTFHFYLSGEDFDTFRDKDLSKIKFVFIKDAENVPRYYLKENQQLFPGEGVVPLIQILSHLRDGGFDGYIVPEVKRPEYEKLDFKTYSSKLIESTKSVLSSL